MSNQDVDLLKQVSELDALLAEDASEAKRTAARKAKIADAQSKLTGATTASEATLKAIIEKAIAKELAKAFSFMPESHRAFRFYVGAPVNAKNEKGEPVMEADGVTPHRVQPIECKLGVTVIAKTRSTTPGVRAPGAGLEGSGASAQQWVAAHGTPEQKAEVTNAEKGKANGIAWRIASALIKKSRTAGTLDADSASASATTVR